MIKQVIVIRSDLKMRRGKECAQAAHASMKWLADRIKQLPPGQDWYDADDPNRPKSINVDLTISLDEEAWLFGKFTKICVRAESEAQLLALEKAAKDAGLTTGLIQDSGATEFGGVPTYTALAIGPNEASAIDAITGALVLY